MNRVYPSAGMRSAQQRAWLMSLVKANVWPEDVDVPTAKSVRMPSAYAKKERLIARQLGGYPLILPYSDVEVTGPGQTDVDHVVPIAEAMASGGRVWSRKKWRAFQGDPANLMLAVPGVNRFEKRAFDIGEWLPSHNVLWYVLDVIAVKLSHGLTFDPQEVLAIQRQFALADASLRTRRKK